VNFVSNKLDNPAFIFKTVLSIYFPLSNYSFPVHIVVSTHEQRIEKFIFVISNCMEDWANSLKTKGAERARPTMFPCWKVPKHTGTSTDWNRHIDQILKER